MSEQLGGLHHVIHRLALPSRSPHEVPTKSSRMLCTGTLKSGAPCNYRAKSNGYCGIHFPEKSTKMEWEAECPICMEGFKPATMTKLICGHRFHRSCVSQWEDQGKHTCPICRAAFKAPDPKAHVTSPTPTMPFQMYPLSAEIRAAMVETAAFLFMAAQQPLE